MKFRSPRAFGLFIVKWFAEHKRDFPWRLARVQCDPYAVWVSEVMLQQTQASRVVPFFVNFMQRFPEVSSLASATWEEVLPYVRGLGYYRRFRNFIVSARMIVDEFSGKFPCEYTDLRRLPGIGEYTAHAILAFTGRLRDAPVPMDTNVRRVLRLFFGQNLHDAELKQIANEACPSGKSREFSQGMMDFATLTMSKKVTNKKITPSIRTQKALKRNSDKPIFRVAAAILWRKNEKNIEILIQTRPGSHHAVHEFPGGKIESGESERACLKRELMEEIGIEASVRPPFLRTEYIFDDKVIYFSWHRCQILLGEPYGKEGQEIRWIRISELCHYVFPPSNDEVIRSLAS